MFDKIAEELKKAREEKKFTINQLASKTKIDIKFLEAIEAGDFAFLPDLYVKAFVKEYARTVGLDEQKIIKKYEAVKQGKYYDEPEPEQEKETPRENKTPEPEVKKNIPPVHKPSPPPVQSYDATALSNISDDPGSFMKKRNMMILGGIIGLAILSLLIYLIFFSGGSEIIVNEKPIEEVVESKQRYYEDEPGGGTAATTASSDSLSLLITAKDTSWVQIIFDDKKVEEFILFPNSNKLIKALNNYKITFGKSGAIQLQLNNKPLGFTGRGNSVAYVLIDSNGVRYLNSPPRVPVQ